MAIGAQGGLGKSTSLTAAGGDGPPNFTQSVRPSPHLAAAILQLVP